jgi:hypothetical protein
MRFIFRKFSIVFVVVVAVSALVSASAFAALPEFEKPFPNKFEVTGPGVSLHTVGGREPVYCGLGTFKGSGEVTGAKALTATFTLTWCLYRDKLCMSVGAKAGEIKLELEGTPYYIEKGKALGLLLKRKGGGNFMEYTCGSSETETVKVRGSLIGVLSFANATTTEFRLAFSEKKGVQEPVEYKNEKGEQVKAILEAEGSGKEKFAFEQTGYQTEALGHIDAVTTAVATKLKATLASRGLPEFRPAWVSEALAFEGGRVRAPLFEVSTVGSWDYNQSSINGNLISPNELAMTITFGEGSQGACLNGGGKLVTNTLIGRLGYLNKASKEVGLLLEPINRLVVKCGGGVLGEEEWTGAVLGKVTPIGGVTKTLELAFAQYRGVQNLQKFEGEEASHHLVDIFGKSKEEPMGLGAELELRGFPAEFKIEA